MDYGRVGVLIMCECQEGKLLNVNEKNVPIEDYIPTLKVIGKLLLDIDENNIDTQEMDYIDEIISYGIYLSEKYEGVIIKKHILRLINRKY
jgi:hypothetical protein